MRNIKTISALAATSCLALICASAFAKDAPVLKIENFIGTVEIVTSNTGKITINDADGAKISRSGSNLTIDDEVSIHKYNCRTKKNRVMVGKGKWSVYSNKGYRNIKEFPHVKITAPEGVHLEIDNAIIFGNVETIGSAHLHIGSCGDIKFGDVKGQLDLSVSGSGDVILGNAGVSDISISGVGDVTAKNLASADIDVSGSGDLKLGDIFGSVGILTSGAGDIEINSITGKDLTISVSGSSDITIDGGSVDTLSIKASGASDVTYNGSSVDAVARASGASDINISKPSGHLRSSDSGAADVNIHG